MEILVCLYVYKQVSFVSGLSYFVTGGKTSSASDQSERRSPSSRQLRHRLVGPVRSAGYRNERFKKSQINFRLIAKLRLCATYLQCQSQKKKNAERV